MKCPDCTTFAKAVNCISCAIKARERMAIAEAAAAEAIQERDEKKKLLTEAVGYLYKITTIMNTAKADFRKIAELEAVVKEYAE